MRRVFVLHSLVCGLPRCLRGGGGGVDAPESSCVVSSLSLLPTAPHEDHDRMLRTHQIDVASSRENRAKNRYSNIMPFDRHRVVLAGGVAPDTDFINASWISFSALPREHIIAAQAPLHPDWHGPDTCGDFWRMVWQHDVTTIVALARVQPGFSGSSMYFPSSATSREVRFGAFAIALEAEEALSEDIVLRVLAVRQVAAAAAAGGGGASASASASASDGDAVKRVHHLHYQSFPNYGVPTTPAGVRLMLRRVEEVCAACCVCASTPHCASIECVSHARSNVCVCVSVCLCVCVWLQRQIELGPDARGTLLVHCSGGVGRTGAFLGAYHALKTTLPLDASSEQSEALRSRSDVLSVEAAVREMRHQRHPWMCETIEQYHLIYRTVLEELAARLAKK